MRSDYDVIVLGLGGIGSGALYWAARRLGADVLGLERFELGHDRGGSQDHSRIIRYSYHTPGYVALAAHAYRAWSEVERESGERLVYRSGGLDLFPQGGAIPLAGYSSSLQAEGVPFELLDGGEVSSRWPQFRALEGVTALYQQDGGLVAAARANAAHHRLAREHGAALLERSEVESVRVSGGEVEVRAGGQSAGTYRCRRLIVAAGAWSNDVLRHLGLALPLTVTQEQVTYFQSARLEDFAPERFPVWIWMDDPSYYGLPVFGAAGVKVAQDVGGREVTADTRSFDADAQARARVCGFLERHLPSALGPELYTKTCLYTLTPDRDFVVDRLPGSPEVAVAIGAGHAFKFASALGRILTTLVLDGESEADLAPFRIDRAVLHERDPIKRFMV